MHTQFNPPRKGLHRIAPDLLVNRTMGDGKNSVIMGSSLITLAKTATIAIAIVYLILLKDS